MINLVFFSIRLISTNRFNNRYLLENIFYSIFASVIAFFSSANSGYTQIPHSGFGKVQSRFSTYQTNAQWGYKKDERIPQNEPYYVAVCEVTTISSPFLMEARRASTGINVKAVKNRGWGWGDLSVERSVVSSDPFNTQDPEFRLRNGAGCYLYLYKSTDGFTQVLQSSYDEYIEVHSKGDTSDKNVSACPQVPNFIFGFIEPKNNRLYRSELGGGEFIENLQVLYYEASTRYGTQWGHWQLSGCRGPYLNPSKVVFDIKDSPSSNWCSKKN